MSDQRTDYYLGTYIILAIGSLVTVMGFLGCCGAWKESPWMLGTVSKMSQHMLFSTNLLQVINLFSPSVLCLPDDHLFRRGGFWHHGVLPGEKRTTQLGRFIHHCSQEANYETMIDKSVRNTVEHQYNSSNTAVLHTFDLLQEGVSGGEVEVLEEGGHLREGFNKKKHVFLSTFCG